MARDPLDQFRRPEQRKAQRPPSQPSVPPAESEELEPPRQFDPRTGKEIYQAFRISLRKRDRLEIRHAIDKYKDYCDAGYLGPPKVDSNCWPESLDILVEGVKLPQSADGKIIKFLRRIPKDPFTHSAEWGLRSDQDDQTSTSWGGQNVFDVYSKTSEKSPDGTPYSEF